MQLTLNLNAQCVRKLQALSALLGDNQIEDFESFLAVKIEQIVSDEICVLAGGEPPGVRRAHLEPEQRLSIDHDFLAAMARKPYRELNQENLNPSLIGSGLADDPLPRKKKARVKVAQKAPSRGLTAADLINDERIEDPEHEAISSDSSEETFEDFLGIPSSAPRPSKRGFADLESPLSAVDYDEDSVEETLMSLGKEMTGRNVPSPAPPHAGTRAQKKEPESEPQSYGGRRVTLPRNIKAKVTSAESVEN
jgi:hypothetical protein